MGDRTTESYPLHADLAPLAFLLGTWRGEGSGGFPTISSFRYREEMVFEHVGDTFLLYSQRSWFAEDGEPVHLERGFLRPVGGSGVELVLAHPIGVTEVAEGTLDGSSLQVASTAVGRTATGDAVTGLARRWRVEGDTLSYELDMATTATPMTRHLVGELRRV